MASPPGLRSTGRVTVTGFFWSEGLVAGFLTVPVEGRTCAPVEGRTAVPVEGRTVADGLVEGLCTVVLGFVAAAEPVAGLDTEVEGLDVEVEGLDVDVDGLTVDPVDERTADEERDVEVERDTDDDDDEREAEELDDLVACLFDEEDD